MIIKEVCPGSCEDNIHNFSIVDEKTSNKICENSRCYFMIQYKDKTGVWQGNFDPLRASTFIKPPKEEIKIE